MNIIRVAAAAINQKPLDWVGNYERIIKVIDEAYEKDVKILCLPELCITGYGCEDAFLSESVRKEAGIVLSNISRHLSNKQMLVSVGLPIEIQGALFNGCALLEANNILGIALKQNLASDGVHYESRWFKPWEKGNVINNNGLSIGDIVLNIYGVKIGFEICEDAWVADRPGASLAKRGVDIILNPSASHFAFGKNQTRKNFVTEGSRAFNCVYIYSNLLGNESGRIIYDGDTLVASGGELVASGKRFSFKDHVLTIADVNMTKNLTKKVSSASFFPNVEKFHGDFLNSSFSKASILKIKNKLDQQELSKEDEFVSAASLGLFDYMRKSRSNGFILSLSGGADSSAVACLVRELVKRGISELGVKGFIKKSGLNILINDTIDITEKGENKKAPCSIDSIMNHILTCVYQGTKNSSNETRSSAKKLASSLGAKFINWNIDSINSKYVDMVQKAIGRDLSWETDDIALQNIQARVRSPGVWMLANINNALLLSTSNRSEAAVGYATMDGDTSGGLAPIAGIDKAFLLKWLLSLKGDSFYTSALKDYYKLTPTAELRPQEMKQSDEDDLMPYNVLDYIERAAIRDKMSPVEIYELMIDDDFDPKSSKEWINKFFKLWSRNQWKRERYAPSFHYDDESLDPRSWCRWPILSSGLEVELNNLNKLDY